MKNIKLLRCCELLLIFPVFVSFWLFSRFTSDDAFISWRYGKNLVEAGVWSYNPSFYDLTQSYTSFFYTLLSILPHQLNVDVVLFFKCISLFTLLFFVIWFRKTMPDKLVWLLLFLSLPSTMIHVFGGIETFLFVFLTTCLLVSMVEEDFLTSNLLGLILLFVRPEAWILLGLLPIYFLLAGSNNKSSQKAYKFKDGFASLLILFIPMSLYFMIHKLQFHSFFPNPFYLVSNAPFSFLKLIPFFIFMLPLGVLIPLKKLRMFFVSILFFGAMAFVYASSNLTMNYAGRFEYHVFAPIFLFMVYLATKIKNDMASKLNAKTFILLLLIIFGIFAIRTLKPNHLLMVVNTYPRSIQAHGAFGKILLKFRAQKRIYSFALSDAGMAAYYSRLISLDSLGVGSRRITKDGLSHGLIGIISPDLIAIASEPDKLNLEKYHHQRKVYEWGVKKNFEYLCDIYWSPNYVLKLFSKRQYPEIFDLCRSSKASNNFSKKEYFFLNNLIVAPWRYWHE